MLMRRQGLSWPTLGTGCCPPLLLSSAGGSSTSISSPTTSIRSPSASGCGSGCCCCCACGSCRALARRACRLFVWLACCRVLQMLQRDSPSIGAVLPQTRQSFCSRRRSRFSLSRFEHAEQLRQPGRAAFPQVQRPFAWRFFRISLSMVLWVCAHSSQVVSRDGTAGLGLEPCMDGSALGNFTWLHRMQRPSRANCAFLWAYLAAEGLS